MIQAHFKSQIFAASLVLVLALSAGCRDEGSESLDATPSYTWDLPEHFAPPVVPDDNPMTDAKVLLGRHLFYDPRLSADEDMSCASCHEQAKAFTDGRAQALGTFADLHPRGSMSLANVAYASRLAWANPLLAKLEDQAMMPMFGETPIEMGMAGKETQLLDRLNAEPRYAPLFAAAFPGHTDPITLDHVLKALASFERALISSDAPYDRYVAGDKSALSASQLRGMALFFSERTECFHCHGGFTFSDSFDHEGTPTPEVKFHNTGLYNLDGEGAYPARNTGIHEVTGKASDMGRFKAPTLRNIAVTAPYMHDGSLETLSDVIDHYAAGGRELTGVHAGDGSQSPLKSEFVPGFILDAQEKADLLAFLEALTDQTFLSNTTFANPW